MHKFGIPILLMLMAFIHQGCNDRNRISKVNYNEFEVTPEADSLFRVAKQFKLTKTKREQAIRIGQDFVRCKLHYPKSAVFSDDSHFAAGENTIAILGYVTTTNHFDVSMQHKYQIVMKFMGGEWTDSKRWKCMNVVIRWSDGVNKTKDKQ